MRRAIRSGLGALAGCIGLLLLAACVQPAPAPTSSPPSTPLASLPTTIPATQPLELAVATATPPAYPGATATPAPYDAPPQTAAATATAVASPTAPPATPAGGMGDSAFLPFLPHPLPTPTPTATPTASPTWTPTPVPTPTPIPVLDFAALAAQLQANGEALSTIKIGFHTAIGGNSAGLDEWMRQLDAAGVPVFLKSVDNAQPLYAAQELMKQSGVPHTLVFRRATGDVYDVPEYHLPPDEAARRHWERHMAVWPPELDPGVVWIETVNEVDKNRAEWLGQFALKTAELALASGHRWAAFGWSSGEPEPATWQTPSMLAYLRLAAQHPDRLAVALHEYSYLQDDIGHEYPYKVGRFQELFRICDQYGIPRPTVLITEWGWTYETVPAPDEAMRDVAWVSRLYAPYPQIKGAAIWYLGGGFDGIANQAQRLIYPVMVYALTYYFTAPLPPAQAPITPDAFRP